MDDAHNPPDQPDPVTAGGDARKDFLLSLGDRLRTTTNAAEVKAIAVEMLCQHLGLGTVGYREIDAKGESIRAPSPMQEPRRLREFGGALVDELKAGHTLRVADSDSDLRVSGKGVPELWADLQMRAVIVVPLIRAGRLVAFLYALDSQPRAWTEAEIQLVQDVAERTWEAVERARAEGALRESEERLREIADAMPALISYVDAKRRYRFVNKAYTDWFGRPLDRYLGRHVREVMGDRMYEAHRSYMDRALEGQRITFEADFPSPFTRSTVITHVPHFAEDGQVIGLYSLVQDVTHQKRTEADLRQSRDEFAAVLDAVPAAILIADDPSCKVIRANKLGAEMMKMSSQGNLSKSDPAAPVGHFRVFDPAGRELAADQLPVQRAARGERSFMHEERVAFDDGTVLHLLGNAVPLHDSKGRIRGAVGAFIDIGERKRAEDALREERSTLEILNRTGTALAAELDLERLMQLITDAGVAVTGAEFGAFFYHITDETGDKLMLSSLSGADRADFEHLGLPRVTCLLRATSRGEGTVRSDDIHADPRYGRNPPHCGLPAGHLLVRSYLAVPVVSRIVGTIGSLLFGHSKTAQFSERHARLMEGMAAQAAIAIDNARLYGEAQREIEQRRRAEDHQRLLIDELNHRVKNSLAIVQSVAHQTFRDGIGIEEARRAFEGRLEAMSSAHNVLTRRKWEHARFREIVESALAPFHPSGSGRTLVAGKDMRLQPKTAVSLAMAFHELATNAVKYGAWSNETGRVVVEWEVVRPDPTPRLSLVWREEGGPPVTSPRRKGFGTRMVERALAAELEGTVDLVFDSAGLRCEINAPLPPPPQGAGAHTREGQA